MHHVRTAEVIPTLPSSWELLRKILEAHIGAQKTLKKDALVAFNELVRTEVPIAVTKSLGGSLSLCLQGLGFWGVQGLGLRILKLSSSILGFRV